MDASKKPHSFLSLQLSPWLFIFIIVALGCFYLLSVRTGHDWGDDFAAYIHHAKNITEGRHYADIKFIQNPFNRIAPEAYPPVFPFLLSIVYRLFGMNLLAMKTTVILFWVGALWLMYLLLRNRLTGIFLVLFLLTVGLHPFLWNFLNNILSETAFLFFVLLSLCLAEHLDKDRLSAKKKIFVSIGLGLAMCLACGTRAIGIALALAVIAHDFFKHKRLRKETVLALAICLIMTALQTSFMYKASNYFSYFNPALVSDKIVFYLTTFYFFNPTELDRFFFLIKLSLGFIGLYLLARKGCSPLDFFVFFYIGILFTYALPYSQFDAMRFFIPILPFYFYYVFFGIQEAILNKKSKPILIVIIFVVIAVFQVGPAIARERQNNLNNGGVATREAQDLFRYIIKNTQPDDVFIFIKPRALTLFTDRPASVYYAHKDEGDFWTYAGKIGVRYIVVFKRGDAYLKYIVGKYSEKLTKVYENPGFQVFKIK